MVLEYCVTGGAGYLGGHLVKALLHQGHRVRTTARDPEDWEKVGYLWEFPGARERLKIVKADLLVEGSFDEAIKDVDGVFHTASPVAPNGGLQETLVDPIIKGCMNVLNSCVKSKSSVKRVVLTSSVSTVVFQPLVLGQDQTCHNESSWSDLEYCKRKDNFYAYAKTIAEKEALRVAQENAMDLVVVNPSFILGPQLAQQPSSSNLSLLAIIKGLVPESKLPFKVAGFVHVEDVVAAHILAMEDSRASGRLICSSSVAHFADIVDMLRAMNPTYPYTKICKREEEEAHETDTSKIRELGFPAFKTIPDMLHDCVKSFQDKGFL